MNRLDGLDALVIGAGGGIGAAVAVALAAEGVRVRLCGRREMTLSETARRIPMDRLAGTLVADLAKEGVAEAIASAVGGRLDLLVHAAGIFSAGSAADLRPEECAALFRVNALAPADVTRALLPALRVARGQVVFVNSSAALHPSPTWSVYAASKAALKVLADGIRGVVNAEGVRVISVYPGRTASPMQAAIHQMEGRPYDPSRLLQPEDIAAMIVSALALPRTAEATDLQIRPMQKS